MLHKFKSTYLFLIIGFMISSCTISIAISSLYPFYSQINEKNRFLERYDLIKIYKEGTSLNISDIEEDIEKNSVTDYIFAPINTEIIKDSGYIMCDLWVIPNGFDLKKSLEITNSKNIDGKFKSGRNYAIIGKNIKGLETEVDNKKYVDLFKKEYEIISEIGENEYFSSSVFVSSKVKEFKNKKFSSLNLLILKSDINKIENLSNEGYEVQIEEIKKEPILEVLKQIPLELERRAYELAVGILNLIIFSYFFSNSIKKDVAIKRVLGASNNYILKDILKRMFIIATIGTSLGVIMSSVIVQFMNSTNAMAYGEINLIGIILTAVVVFMISLIVTFIVLLNVIRFKIMKEIR